ncbi:MAG: histidinol-phosphate aminotransferase family protein, partial [Saprospiraceae bacterium]|nr:histidinol-phosphate aminotransferase family protein [Saprospiraceae bacterium]
GTMSEKDALLDFCNSVSPNTIIFLDEAYMEFTDAGLKSSLAHEVFSLPNLIVARTFSKIYGLAGLRVGYAYAHPDLIKKMKHYHIGFEINMPITSLHAAIAAIDDQEFVLECKEKNREVKKQIYQSFDQWNIKYLSSETNFIYFETKHFKPGLVDFLKQNQILIRDYKDQPGYARVSMGTSDQIDQFLSKSEQFLAL